MLKAMLIRRLRPCEQMYEDLKWLQVVLWSVRSTCIQSTTFVNMCDRIKHVELSRFDLRHQDLSCQQRFVIPSTRNKSLLEDALPISHIAKGLMQNAICLNRPIPQGRKERDLVPSVSSHPVAGSFMLNYHNPRL